MKALFLAGGMGMRLRPITDNLPKPMVPIMGKPLLERNIKNLRNYGIREIVLSTCYKPYEIEKYFKTGEKMNVKIEYISEDVPLGTAGAVKNAENFLEDTFLVFNADILSDIDIGDLIKFHKHKGGIATIAATEIDDPSSYGVMEHCPEHYVTTFKEKPKYGESKSKLINAGIYVFERELLDEIPEKSIVSMEREVFPKLLEIGKKIALYNSCFYWMDLGTPQKYVQAHRDILNGDLRLEECDFNVCRHYINNGAKIHPTATLIPPVYIGKGVEIHENAVIGAGVALGNRVTIGANSKIENSIIWDGVKIKDGDVISDSVVTSSCIVNNSGDVAHIGKKLSNTMAV